MSKGTRTRRPAKSVNSEPDASDATIAALEGAMQDQDEMQVDSDQGSAEASSVINGQLVVLSQGQFETLLQRLAVPPAAPSVERTVPEGERFEPRTMSQLNSQYPSIQEKSINWDDPEWFTMRVEKLSSQIEDELGSRVEALQDKGWEVLGQTRRFFFVRLPREEYNRRIKRMEDEADRNRRATPMDAEAGVSVDEETLKEVSIKELFDGQQLSTKEKVEFLSDGGRASEMLREAREGS